MHKIAIRVGFLVLLLAGAAFPAQEMSSPRIEVKHERYDMGNIAQGTPAVHVFTVRNAGTAPLVIEGVQAS